MPEIPLNDICYSSNFLVEVIARIDFVNPISTLVDRIPKELVKDILKRFPILEPQKAVEQHVQLSKDEVSSKRTEYTEWKFFGKNREKELRITPSAILVVCKEYSSYEKFKDDFLSICKMISTSFDEAQASRIGLRYVNHIRIKTGDPVRWNGYISKELLGLFSFKIPGARFARLFHVMEFTFENFLLRYQFGMPNPDYPAQIKQKLFVLDFDAFRHDLLNLTQLEADLDSFHLEIQKLFESSITEKMRRVLNG